MFEHIRSYLTEFEKRGIPGMDIRILKDGREVYRECRGVSDENGTPMRGDERYNLYSCSKVVTCTAAMMLIEEGKLSLDDEVALYLPAFSDMTVKKNGAVVKAEKRIAVRHLFTMTAGLDYNLESGSIARGKRETDGRCPTVEMMKYIAREPLQSEPGEAWHYSLCHDVLAAVVEVVSGMRFGEFVRTRIFSPLGMHSSTFLLPAEELPTITAQYRWEKGTLTNVGRGIVRYQPGSLYESGGAGMIGSVDDYILFLEALRTHRLITEASLDLMRTEQMDGVDISEFWPRGDGYSYGLGIRIPRRDTSRTDFGWGGAAGAYLAIDPENAISIYFAQHVLASPNSPIRKDLIEAAKLDLGMDAYKENLWRGTGVRLA